MRLPVLRTCLRAYTHRQAQTGPCASILLVFLTDQASLYYVSFESHPFSTNPFNYPLETAENRFIE